MSIQVVLPFCKSDAIRAEALIDWIGEIGGCHEHSLILVADIGVDSTIIERKARSMFLEVSTIRPPFKLKNETHPIGPNWMFETTLKHLAKSKSETPFLWLEPDCVPMRRGWLAEIETEYKKAGMRIMAGVIALNDPRYPKTIPSGVAVYPADAWKIYGKLQTNRTVAWDIQFADSVKPICQPSATIASRLNHLNAPTFVERREPHHGKNAMMVSDIPATVSLFHPNKDGTLIKVLRKSTSKKFQLPTLIDFDNTVIPAPDAHDGAAWKLDKFIATVPIIRAAKQSEPSARANKIIHCVQRWRPKSREIDCRIHTAVLSWIELYKNGDTIPCHIWHPFKRDAKSLGDARELPFLKDVISEGMKLAKLPDDIILLTNDDSVLSPELDCEIFERLLTKPCICTGRLNFQRGEKPDFTSNREFLTKSNDIGRDAFAFRFDWLKKNFQSIPDMLLAEAQFDIVLGSMIRKANGVKPTINARTEANPKCELPYGWVQHEDHIRGWNCGPTLGQIYNLKLAAEWYIKNGMPHMVDFNYTSP